MTPWLRETRQLDISEPRLRITAQKLTQSHQTQRARAAALCAFVRRMPVSALPRGGRRRASEVLAHGRADDEAKCILLTALCRAAGLPARMQYLQVRPRFLAGLLHAVPATLQVTLVQVCVDGQWVATDAHVVDPVLFAHAKHMLRASGRAAGWGLRADAPAIWDGQSNLVQQFGSRDIQRDLGVHDDADAFRRSGGRPDDDTIGIVVACLLNWRLAQLRRVRVELAQTQEKSPAKAGLEGAGF